MKDTTHFSTEPFQNNTHFNSLVSQLTKPTTVVHSRIICTCLMKCYDCENLYSNNMNTLPIKHNNLFKNTKR